MNRLPRLTAQEVVQLLEKAGFKLARQRGSHKIFKNDIGKRVTVPFHSGKTLHPKLLKAILSDAEIDVKELKK
jgi:predicted RNA binding protein YcfA (HicA-like mRNA interferase family)